MTAPWPSTPLDDAGRAELNTAMSQMFAMVDRDHPDQVPHLMSQLMEWTLLTYGYPGVLEVAINAVRAITRGVGIGWDHPDIIAAALRRGTRPQYVGFGSTDQDAIPQTDIDYAVARFATAIIAGDPAGAWAEFDRWQPDKTAPPTRLHQDCISDLMSRALNREVAGGELAYEVRPGDRWPPRCDFCCAATATRMWRCRPFRMQAAGHPAGIGGLVISHDDVDRWYGCRTCTPLVETDQWATLAKRFHHLNPESARSNPAMRGNLSRLWASFAENRVRRRSEKLPKTRPATQRELDEQASALLPGDPRAPHHQ